MNKWLVSLSVVVAVSGGIVQAAGDVDAGKAKAASCAGCHGINGNSPNTAWPNLAGQHQPYLEKQIMDFRSGERKDPMMTATAKGIATPEDIANISAYFSAQALNVGQAKTEAVSLGTQVFRGGNAATGVAACGGCHGPAGMGNLPANFPRISGQNVGYVTKALKDFRAGTRTNDANGMMRGVAARMSDAEIEAVAQYLHGLTE